MRNVWEKMVRDGHSVRDAAKRLGVSEDFARREMNRVRPVVAAREVEAKVARHLRTSWNPYTALSLR